MMLGTEPSRSAVFARDYFARVGAKEILIPVSRASVRISYGRWREQNWQPGLWLRHQGEVTRFKPE